MDNISDIVAYLKEQMKHEESTPCYFVVENTDGTLEYYYLTGVQIVDCLGSGGEDAERRFEIRLA